MVGLPGRQEEECSKYSFQGQPNKQSPQGTAAKRTNFDICTINQGARTPRHRSPGRSMNGVLCNHPSSEWSMAGGRYSIETMGSARKNGIGHDVDTFPYNNKTRNNVR